MTPGAEVVVIGGGVIGAATTYYLSRRGIGVHLIEQAGIAGGSSSACASGVSLQTKTPGIKQHMARHSLEIFSELGEELQTDFEFRQRGGLLVAESEAELDLIRERGAQIAAAGLTIELLTGPEARDHQPGLAPHVVGAIHCAEEATVNPYLLTLGFVRAARRAGATVTTHTRVTAIELHRGRVTAVTTDRGRIETPTVVNAAGVGAPAIGRLAGIEVPVSPTKGELFVTQAGPPLLQGNIISASYLLSKAGGATDPGKTSGGLWAGQTARGNLVVGSTREQAGYDSSSSASGLRVLLHNVATLLPAAADLPVIRFFGGLRPASADGLPFLGRWPSLPGMVLAAGHEGDGIALSPVTGLRIAQIIAGEIEESPNDPLSPLRLVEGASHD